MKHNLLIFPIILLLTFIVAYLTLDYFNKNNELLVEQTRSKILPGIEISTNINHELDKLQHNLQDATASADQSKLIESYFIVQRIDSLISLLEEKQSLKTKPLKLTEQLHDYYETARIVSIEMMEGDFSEVLSNKISTMLAKYNKLSKTFNQLKSDNKTLANLHFREIENNNSKSSAFNLLISFLGLIVSIIISYFFSKAIARPIKQMNNELLASEEELRQMNEELTTINEILAVKNNELQKALKQLKETQSQLIQSEKMASIGILISGISHEINNPLNYIMAGATIIEKHLAKSANGLLTKLNPFIDGLKLGIKRITNIVNSLGYFQNTGDESTKTVDIHAIIEHCLTILNNQLLHRVEVVKEFCAESCNIIGNESKLHQVVLNILSNAEQAIISEGQITIKTTRIDKKLKVLISDTGCGIKEEDLAKISDPFFTTKEPGKGTGLGLTITSKIIEEHEGSINYISEFGKGTTVEIILPIEKCANND